MLVIGFLAFSSWQKGADLEKATQELTEARGTNEAVVAQLSSLTAELTASQARIEELRKENEKATLAQKTLEQEMRSALDTRMGQPAFRVVPVLLPGGGATV